MLKNFHQTIVVQGNSESWIAYLIYLMMEKYLIKRINAALHKCTFEKVFWKYAANLQENTHAYVSKKLYWNHTSAWVLSCKFAAYFQNTFS